TSGGDVSIDNSHFDRNKTAGAIIRAKGNVAISSSSFSNPANGRRQATGMDIASDGSVSLFDVLADQNRQVCAIIKAGSSVAIGATANPFTATPTSSFSGTKIIQGSTFLGYGLQVETPQILPLPISSQTTTSCGVPPFMLAEMSPLLIVCSMQTRR